MTASSDYSHQYPSNLLCSLQQRGIDGLFRIQSSQCGLQLFPFLGWTRACIDRSGVFRGHLQRLVSVTTDSHRMLKEQRYESTSRVLGHGLRQAVWVIRCCAEGVAGRCGRSSSDRLQCSSACCCTVLDFWRIGASAENGSSRSTLSRGTGVAGSAVGTESRTFSSSEVVAFLQQ